MRTPPPLSPIYNMIVPDKPLTDHSCKYLEETSSIRPSIYLSVRLFSPRQVTDPWTGRIVGHVFMRS